MIKCEKVVKLNYLRMGWAECAPETGNRMGGYYESGYESGNGAAFKRSAVAVLEKFKR